MKEKQTITEKEIERSEKEIEELEAFINVHMDYQEAHEGGAFELLAILRENVADLKQVKN